jgi:UDPglucose--hexose-1-phosphate uridylyltransferase
MGTSNAHPHGQVWAQETLPNEIVKELRQQQLFAQSRGTCLLCSYLDVELTQAERVVSANDSFVAVVPYWAVWPYETLVLPRQHGGGLSGLSVDERRAFADILRRLTRGYDQLFDATFP